MIGDARPRFLGRHVGEGDRTLFGWSGSGFEARFLGTEIVADLSGSACWIDIQVDGASRAVELDASTRRLVLAADLAPGEHRVVVRKRTEAHVGDLRLGEIRLGPGDTWLAPEPPKGPRIAFHGDSITCGYGAWDPDPLHGFLPATEDFCASWAAVATESVGGDLHAQCWSGKGVVRNYPGVEGPTLPELWDLALPTRQEIWNPANWVPDLLVFNLGSNDYGAVPFLADDAFVGGWLEWLPVVRSSAPRAQVVLVDGPLLTETHPAPGTLTLVRTLLDRVAREIGGAERGVHRFSLSPIDSPEGYGADYHPSVVQHRRNGAEFAAFLRRILA